jgi:hypothetical protein
VGWPKTFRDGRFPFFGVGTVEIECGASVLERVRLIILDAATHEMPHKGL